jgi:hypothetical protein
MAFSKGNQLGKANRGRKKETPKTIWLLQSLQENGVDLQSLLAKSILKASHGDRQAMDLAHLLTKLLPLVSNAPKNDAGTTQIETLVINRYSIPADTSSVSSEVINRFVDTTVVPETEGHPPLTTP